jgi:hypothetical protein
LLSVRSIAIGLLATCVPRLAAIIVLALVLLIALFATLHPLATFLAAIVASLRAVALLVVGLTALGAAAPDWTGTLVVLIRHRCSLQGNGLPKEMAFAFHGSGHPRRWIFSVRHRAI